MLQKMALAIVRWLYVRGLHRNARFARHELTCRPCKHAVPVAKVEVQELHELLAYPAVAELRLTRGPVSARVLRRATVLFLCERRSRHSLRARI